MSDSSLNVATRSRIVEDTGRLSAQRASLLWLQDAGALMVPRWPDGNMTEGEVDDPHAESMVSRERSWAPGLDVDRVNAEMSRRSCSRSEYAEGVICEQRADSHVEDCGVMSNSEVENTSSD